MTFAVDWVLKINYLSFTIIDKCAQMREREQKRKRQREDDGEREREIQIQMVYCLQLQVLKTFNNF